MARNQQIRDRVAFGDDLFRLENQTDGRVRLIPAPNQVTTQGTDVNAELMQPWEDMHTAATRNGLVRLGRDAGGMPELTIPQLDSLSTAVESVTAAAVAAKTANLDGFVRRRGSTVWVRFSAGNFALNPTLNINSTGAAAIQLNGTALNDANLARQIAPNVLYGFVFDGAAWQMIVPGSNLPTMGQGFGTVSTAAATAAKVGVLAGFVRRTGSVVWLRFTVQNTAVSPTLNVDNTGAAAIQLSGGALPAGAIVANWIYGFVFDGANWQILNPTTHPHNAADITAGRLLPARLPTSGTASRVLAVGAANTDPAFVQVNNDMIADNTIRQSKLHVVDGFAELGFSGGAILSDVINAIRALPITRPVLARFSITSAAMAGWLRAPLTDTNSMMQIERAQNTSNMLLLTYYTGLNTPNGLRVFYANHANATATNESVTAIVWRENLLLSGSRIAFPNLPTSATAHRVLAVGAANTNPSFVQVNQSMMSDNSVGTGQIQDGSVTNSKIANLAVDNAKIANDTIRQSKLHIVDGFAELGFSGGALLVDVINAIRALPITRPISARFSITSAAVAGWLRAPLTDTNSMMQIERTQNTSNMLLLTYYTGLNTPNGLRVFYANHANATATNESVTAIVWRENLLLSGSRIAFPNLPTSATAHRVLAVGAANTNPSFVQVNQSMMSDNSVGTAQIQNGSVTNSKLANLAVDNANIANDTIRQSKLHVVDGFAELGFSGGALLADVINAIRALPITRPISARFSITSTAMAGWLRAPLTNINSMMQIERAQNTSNMLLLTYYTGLNITNGLRIFYANHANVAATNESTAAIVWREVPQLNNGRLSLPQLPTSDLANRVLAVGTAGSGPAFVQVSNAMISANAVETAQIRDGSVTNPKIADLSVTNAKIVDNTIRQSKLHVVEGFAELGLPATATLVDAINAIQALPLTRPVSARFNITNATLAGRFRAPLVMAGSVMQIERTQNNSNILTLIFFAGVHTNNMRIFTAGHGNETATNISVDTMIWREIPQLNNGRLSFPQLPTSDLANSVLAVGAANSNPTFLQINSNMIADNAITATKIENVAAINRNIAIGANSSIAGSGASGNMALGDTVTVNIGVGNTSIGAGSAITGGSHNIAIGDWARVSAANSEGNIVIGRHSYASHVQAAIISPNTGWVRRASPSDNSVTIGNPTTTVGGWGAWNNLSDARDKRDISPLKYDPLAFVNALSPKQYRTDFRSAYRCYQEISEKEYKALNEYDKRHRVHETDVYTINGTNIEWIEDASILTNNGRIKELNDVPDLLENTASSDRYSTKYLCKYAKSKEVAAQKFKADNCIDLPEIQKAHKLFSELHGADVQIDSFIESCIKTTRKAKFLMVDLKPDGTYAGKRHHWGFMAQEVEQTAKDMGIDCPAVQYLAHNKDKDGIPEGDDLYTMGYTQLIAPLVGAVQQLTGMVQQLQGEIMALKKKPSKNKDYSRFVLK